MIKVLLNNSDVLTDHLGDFSFNKGGVFGFVFGRLICNEFYYDLCTLCNLLMRRGVEKKEKLRNVGRDVSIVDTVLLDCR